MYCVMSLVAVIPPKWINCKIRLADDYKRLALSVDSVPSPLFLLYLL